ncbi:kinase-like domain-containing protein, partial [Phlyctochytrium arcticum]
MATRLFPLSFVYARHQPICPVKLLSLLNSADNVWYGLCKATSEEVVLKLFEREHFSDTEAPRDAAVLTEVQILKDLSKQYPARVIQFRNFYANDEDQLVLVMEAAETTLQEVLDLKGRLTEDDAREAIFGMLEAVFCVHQAQLVHRDIKPANLMLMDRNDFSSLKIADFGVTVGNVGYDSLNQIAGTMGYEAPEMLAHSFYGKAVDLWSCGVTAYQLLYGHVPFKPTASTGLFATKKIGPKQQLDAIKRGYDLSSGGVVVSDEGKHLIRGLLEIDPARRFTAEQALRHPW